MEKVSIKQLILDFLKGRDFVFGGTIEDYIRSIYGPKASNVSRRCRELENGGLIEVRKVQVNGRGPFVTQYRLKMVDPLFNNPKQLSLV